MKVSIGENKKVIVRLGEPSFLAHKNGLVVVNFQKSAELGEFEKTHAKEVNSKKVFKTADLSEQDKKVYSDLRKKSDEMRNLNKMLLKEEKLNLNFVDSKTYKPFEKPAAEGEKREGVYVIKENEIPLLQSALKKSGLEKVILDISFPKKKYETAKGNQDLLAEFKEYQQTRWAAVKQVDNGIKFDENKNARFANVDADFAGMENIDNKVTYNLNNGKKEQAFKIAGLDENGNRQAVNPISLKEEEKLLKFKFNFQAPEPSREYDFKNLSENDRKQMSELAKERFANFKEKYPVHTFEKDENGKNTGWSYVPNTQENKNKINELTASDKNVIDNFRQNIGAMDVKKEIQDIADKMDVSDNRNFAMSR